MTFDLSKGRDEIYDRILKQEVEELCFESFVNKIKKKTNQLNISAAQKILKKTKSFPKIDFNFIFQQINTSVNAKINNEELVH